MGLKAPFNTHYVAEFADLSFFIHKMGIIEDVPIMVYLVSKCV